MSGPSPRAVVGVGVLVALALGILLARMPPSLAEAFEYAELARNWVEHGELREDHFRDWFPVSQEMELPHPGGQRVNLYVPLLVPFVLLFGYSHWVVSLPGILGHLLLGFASWRLARSCAGRGVAGWVAIGTLVHPAIVDQVVTDPHPAGFAWAFALLSVEAVVRRRWIVAGALAAVAALFALPAALVALGFPLWVLLGDRAALREPRLWGGALAGLLVLAPFGARNVAVFGTPFFAESESQTGSFTLEQLEETSRFEILFALERPDAPPDDLASRFRRWRANTADQLFGEDKIDYHPGLLELALLPLVPFAIAGAWRARKERGTRVLLVIGGAYVVLFGLLTRGYEDRYFFHLVPFAGIFAARGFAARPRWLDGRGFLVAVLVCEVVLPWLPMVEEAWPGRDERARQAAEFEQAARWIREETPEDARVVSFLPFSTAYFARRLVLPLPYGGPGELVAVARRHDARVLLYTRMFGPQTLPRLDFLEPVASGEFVTLARIDPTAPSFRDLEAVAPWVRDERPLAAYDRIRDVSSLTRRPLWGFLTRALGLVPGLALYAGLLVGFAALWRRTHRAHAPLALGLVVVSYAVRVLVLGPLPAVVHWNDPRPLAVPSLVALVDEAGARAAPVLLVDAADATDGYRAELEAAFGASVAVAGLDALEARRDALVVVPLPEPTGSVATRAAFERSGARLAELERRAAELAARTRAAGRRGTWIGGAWVVPPERDAAP